MVGCKFALQLASAAMLSGMCAINWLGVASILKEARAYYGVGTGAINTVSNMYLFVYCVTCIPSAYATDRWGVKWALLLGGFSQALGAAVCGISKTYTVLVLGSIIAAAGQPFLVASPAAFSERYAPRKYRARATTVVSVCNNLGSAVVYAAAPRATAAFHVRGWLLIRAAGAIFIFLVAVIAFAGDDQRRRTKDDNDDLEEALLDENEEPPMAEAFYFRNVMTMMSPAFGYLLVSYCFGQGAFWSWAELPDQALEGHSDTAIGNVGAVVTVIACLSSVLFGNLVDSETAPLEVVLLGAQLAAAIALLCFYATLRMENPSWTLIAASWLGFSLASTPIMPLGSELAARLAPSPDVIGAAVGAAFFVAEISSAALGFGLGASSLSGADLVFVLFLITAVASVAAIFLVNALSRRRSSSSDTKHRPLASLPTGIPSRIEESKDFDYDGGSSAARSSSDASLLPSSTPNLSRHPS